MHLDELFLAIDKQITVILNARDSVKAADASAKHLPAVALAGILGEASDNIAGACAALQALDVKGATPSD